jgi:phospholipid N-methyltransferase
VSSLSDAVIFLREFLKNPRQLGSIIPSSSFLKRRIMRAAGVHQAKTIVELGPGNGGTTRSILAAMPADARLLSIELNEGLFQLSSRISDQRYIAHHGDAHELSSILEQYQLDQPDVVISGIPFSCMERSAGAALIQRIHALLQPGGRFVAYQVNPRVDQLNTFFRAENSRSVAWEWLSIPPLRVWRWQKQAAA